MKSENKKIIIFGLALLILAGIIVVMLKGFNVSLDLQRHDTLKFVFSQKFEKDDVEKICKDVFKDKEYKIKTVEVFTDAIYIISPNITEDEKTSLLEKLNELYAKEDSTYETTEESVTEVAEDSAANSVSNEETDKETIYENLTLGQDYEFYSDAKVRIRDIVRPYIIPSLISAIIIILYIAFKYRKLNNGNFLVTVCKTLGEIFTVLLILLSLIAILRIEFTRSLIPFLMFIVLGCLVFRLGTYEKELKQLDEKK